MGTQSGKRHKLNLRRIHGVVTHWILVSALLLGGVGFLAYEARAATLAVQDLWESIWGGRNADEESDKKEVGQAD